MLYNQWEQAEQEEMMEYELAQEISREIDETPYEQLLDLTDQEVNELKAVLMLEPEEDDSFHRKYRQHRLKSILKKPLIDANIVGMKRMSTTFQSEVEFDTEEEESESVMSDDGGSPRRKSFSRSIISFFSSKMSASESGSDSVIELFSHKRGVVIEPNNPPESSFGRQFLEALDPFTIIFYIIKLLLIYIVYGFIVSHSKNPQVLHKSKIYSLRSKLRNLQELFPLGSSDLWVKLEAIAARFTLEDHIEDPVIVAVVLDANTPEVISDSNCLVNLYLQSLADMIEEFRLTLVVISRTFDDNSTANAISGTLSEIFRRRTTKKQLIVINGMENINHMELNTIRNYLDRTSNTKIMFMLLFRQTEDNKVTLLDSLYHTTGYTDFTLYLDQRLQPEDNYFCNINSDFKLFS